jgi:hypothetical protein
MLSNAKIETALCFISYRVLSYTKSLVNLMFEAIN